MEETLYGLSLSDLQSSTKVSGGTYYDFYGYCLYVPDEVDTSTSAFIYYPGSGGSGNDAVAIRNLINSEESPNQIIVIADDAYAARNTGGDSYFELINNIGAANGVNITNISSMGFSASGPTNYNTLINNISRDEEHSSKYAVFADIVSIYPTDEEMELLKESDSTLIFFEPNGAFHSFENTLGTNGVDVIVAQAGGEHSSHVALNRDALENGIIDFISGESDEFGDIYTFYSYNTDTGKWEEISLEEVAEKINVSSGGISYKYYEKLSNLEELQSSNSFIQSGINAIRNAIKNTNFLSSTSGTVYESTTNVPNAEPELVQSFFSTCAKLLNLLEKDTVTIVEIGEMMQETNVKLADEASKLNDSSSSEDETNTIDYYDSSNKNWVDNTNSGTGNNDSNGSNGSNGSGSYEYSDNSNNSSTSNNSSSSNKNNGTFSSDYLTSSDYDVEAGGVYNYDGIEEYLEDVNGVSVALPAGLGSVHTYMGWQCITARSSNQYKLREAAGMNFDEEGFAKIGDRYVVAVTTTFGNVGDYIDVYQEDGTVIKCVIGDIKSQNDAGCTEWGHNNGQCVVEFVVDKSSWYGSSMHSNPGTSACHPEWNQNITKIVNKGSFFELINTEAAQFSDNV